MANKNKDEEELDKDLEEIESLDDNESEEEKVKDKEKQEEPEDQQDEDEEDEDQQDRTAKTDDREALRERRRREKKMKRERDRREKALMASTIVALQEEVKNLKNDQNKIAQNFEGVGVQQIKNEMRELNTIYVQANAAIKKAMSENDSEALVEAMSIKDKALSRYNKLESVLSIQNDKLSKKELEQTREDADHKEPANNNTITLSKSAQNMGFNFMKKNPWYDANGGNLDSKIVNTIDQDLYNEGWDPEDPSYWEELEDRAKQRLPHRFNKVSSQKKPNIVGGTGESSGRAKGEEAAVPREFVQTLKAAGYWNNPEKRKAAIKDYLKNRKRG